MQSPLASQECAGSIFTAHAVVIYENHGTYWFYSDKLVDELAQCTSSTGAIEVVSKEFHKSFCSFLASMRHEERPELWQHLKSEI